MLTKVIIRLQLVLLPKNAVSKLSHSLFCKLADSIFEQKLHYLFSYYFWFDFASFLKFHFLQNNGDKQHSAVNLQLYDKIKNTHFYFLTPVSI